MRQFDIVELSDRTLAVIVQSDLLDAMESRVVAPLVKEPSGIPASRMHLKFRVGRHDYVLMPERMGGVIKSEIRRVVQSAKDREWELRRAIDIVFVGV